MEVNSPHGLVSMSINYNVMIDCNCLSPYALHSKTTHVTHDSETEESGFNWRNSRFIKTVGWLELEIPQFGSMLETPFLPEVLLAPSRYIFILV